MRTRFGMSIIGAMAMFAAACAADSPLQPIGTPGTATINDAGHIQLSATSPATGGAIARPISVGGADAVMAQAIVENAPARGVTLALLDARKGHTVGYWQNVEPLGPTTDVAAFMPVPRTVPRVRLFAGTHDQVSNATIRVGDVTPLRRIMQYRTVMYGSAVSSEKWTAQSFTARGTRLGGVLVHTSLRGERDDNSPDLIVRLFKLQSNIDDTRNSEPIARTVVSNRIVPCGRPLGRDIDLFIPLRAHIEPGAQYLIDFTTTEGNAEQNYLLWCGPDGYDGGQQWINGNAPNWDMHMEIYEEARP
jgi:hypothetical protein